LRYRERRDRIKILPKYYFVVSGTALSSISPLNAFDEALKVAGIHNLNLIEVSSILPRGVIHLELSEKEVRTLFEPGEIVFTVQASLMSSGAENISAGLMWGGLIFEHKLSIPTSEVKPRAQNLKKDMVKFLRLRFQEGVRSRGIKIQEPRFKITELFIPKDMYGCALTSLILC
jgi:arginine decarboxylase